MIEVGQQAPDFKLKGHDDREHALSEYRGRTVVLAFYPLDFSPVCTSEHACFRDDLARFNALDAQVLGVSVDSVWTHKAFARELGLTYPLLADFHPKGEVARRFGLYLEDKGITERATVVIDAQGRVAFTQVHGIPNQPDDEALLEAVRKATR